MDLLGKDMDLVTGPWIPEQQDEALPWLVQYFLSIDTSSIDIMNVMNVDDGRKAARTDSSTVTANKESNFGDTTLVVYNGEGQSEFHAHYSNVVSRPTSSSHLEMMDIEAGPATVVRTNSSNIIHTEEEKWTKKVQVCIAGSELERPLDDGYSWRKYGQKDILGAKYPRGFYKCIHDRSGKGCLAKKVVQRSDDNPTIFAITYHGRHTCSQATPQNPSSSISPEKQEQGQAWKAGASASVVSACPTSFQTASERQGEFRTYSSIVSAHATSFDTISYGERHGEFHEHSSIANETPSDFEMMEHGSCPSVSYYKEKSPSTSVIGQERVK